MGKKDYCSQPLERMVVMGESTVAGGAWLRRLEDHWADVLASRFRGVDAKLQCIDIASVCAN